MIAIQTPSTVHSSRTIRKPDEYEHFRKILKTRQKFPTSSESKYRRRSEATPSKQTRNKASSPLPAARHALHLKVLYMPQRKPDTYYSLQNLPYKNYKYLKPPGKLNVPQYLEGTLKIAQTLGICDRKVLHEKLNPENLRIRESTYTSDHLIKSRKPQGPSSCLETIYIARLELDDQPTEEKYQKIQLMQENLQNSLTTDQVKLPSQSYILNRWTRSAQSLRACQKQELLPKFNFQRQIIDQDVVDLRKSMESVIISQPSTITELPQYQTFIKFDARQNSNKQMFNMKGQTVGMLKENYLVFSKPIVGDRLLLSLNLQPDNVEQKVGFKTFQQFLQVYINKRANLKQAIEAALDFFTLGEPLQSSEFANILRILCDQFRQSHPSTQPMYVFMLENFKLANVLKDGEPIDTLRFKSAFISNQMQIYDIIDLIAD